MDENLLEQFKKALIDSRLFLEERIEHYSKLLFGDIVKQGKYTQEDITKEGKYTREDIAKEGEYISEKIESHIDVEGKYIHEAISSLESNITEQISGLLEKMVDLEFQLKEIKEIITKENEFGDAIEENEFDEPIEGEMDKKGNEKHHS